MFLRKFIESAFEIALKAFSAVGHFGQIAKDLKVIVKVNNLVKTKDPLRKLSVLAKDSWLDLFGEKNHCQITDTELPDLLLTIRSVEGKLSITVESEYLGGENLKTEIGEAFKEFIDEANKILNGILDRDHSLTIAGSLSSEVKTKQVLQLSNFFKTRLSKIFFAVLVKKFVSEVTK